MAKYTLKAYGAKGVNYDSTTQSKDELIGATVRRIDDLLDDCQETEITLKIKVVK